MLLIEEMFVTAGSTDGPEPLDSSPHEPKRTPVTPVPYRSIANMSHQATKAHETLTQRTRQLTVLGLGRNPLTISSRAMMVVDNRVR